MDELLKRVAIAIALVSYPHAAEEIERKGIEAFEDLVEENFTGAARAAIKVMREHG